MPKKHVLLFTLLLCCVTAFAGTETNGYYEARPDFGGAMNRFCVQSTENGISEIDIATAYCPSKE